MIYYRHTDLLLALLRLALWDDKAAFLALKPVSEDEWGVAFKLAANHTVRGMAWQGVCKLQPDEMPHTDLLYTWIAKATVLEKASKHMNTVLAELIDLLYRQGLHPIVKKGQCAAALYEHPLLRECGDIDLFFPTKKEYEQCKHVLGPHSNTPDGCYRTLFKGIIVEVHPQLLDINNPFAAPAIHKLLAEKAYEKIEATPGLELMTAAPEVNLVLLSSHIMKHTFGRGIGLRQMCDLAMACKRYHGIIDSRKAQHNSHSLGLEKWDNLLYSFLVNQLGMPEYLLPFPMSLSNSQSLTRRILHSGNFGCMKYGLSSTSNPVKHKGITAYSMVKNLFWSLHYAPIESLLYFTRFTYGQLHILKK